jgi:hypothetical protein
MRTWLQSALSIATVKVIRHKTEIFLWKTDADNWAEFEEGNLIEKGDVGIPG